MPGSGFSGKDFMKTDEFLDIWDKNNLNLFIYEMVMDSPLMKHSSEE